MLLVSFNRQLKEFVNYFVLDLDNSTFPLLWVLHESLDWMHFLNKWTESLHFWTCHQWYSTFFFMVFYLWWCMSSCLGTLEICTGIVAYNNLIWGEGWGHEESFGTWHGYISRIFFPTTQMWGRFIFTFEINLLECI